MRLWRIHLKPGKRSPHVDIPLFCLEKRVVGIGWRAERRPSSREDYESLCKAQLSGPQLKNWRAASKALLDDIKALDLVWARSRSGTYYLGQVLGAWEYRDDLKHIEADIINVREFDWQPVGEMDLVPGSDITSFIPRRTIQRVKDPDALLYSQFLYSRLKKEIFDPGQRLGKMDILELLSPDDLEDVAALYLQLEKHCLVFPSTCNRDTLAVECLFVDTLTGRPVGLQVKRGEDVIDTSLYKDFDGVVYLFQARGRYRGERHPHCVCLDIAVLREFIESNTRHLPRRVQLWQEFIRILDATNDTHQAQQSSS